MFELLKVEKIIIFSKNLRVRIIRASELIEDIRYISNSVCLAWSYAKLVLTVKFIGHFNGKFCIVHVQYHVTRMGEVRYNHIFGFRIPLELSLR